MKAWIKKHKILFAVEILCLILLLPGCFTGGNTIVKNAELIANGVVRIELSTLQTGVYRLTTESKLADSFVTLSLNAEKETYRALRYNVGRVTPEAPADEMIIYVAGEAENVYLVCTPSGLELNQFSVKLVELNWGSRMLLFGVLAVITAWNLLAAFREKALSGAMSGEQLLSYGILVLTVLTVFLPYATNYFSLAGELSAHLEAIELYGDSFGRGLMNAPMLVFCALFRGIGFPVTVAYKMYLFLAIAVTAGVSYRSFCKCVNNRMAAVFGSVVYMATPYSVSLLYEKQAVDEYTAMIFLPLFLGGIYSLIAEGRKQGHLGKAVGMTAAGVIGLVLCALGAALPAEGTLVNSFVREWGSLLVNALFAMAAAFLADWLSGKEAEDKSACKKAVLVGLFVIAFLVLTFNTNEIALTNPVVRLYEM